MLSVMYNSICSTGRMSHALSSLSAYCCTVCIFQCSHDGLQTFKFSCCSSNHSYHSNSLVQLFLPVLLSASTYTATPQFSVSPQAIVRTNITRPLTLLCAATGKPLPTIEWLRDGVTIGPGKVSNQTDSLVEISSSEVKLETGATAEQSKLVIETTSARDSGAYTCRATNTLGVTDSEPSKVGILGKKFEIFVTYTCWHVNIRMYNFWLMSSDSRTSCKLITVCACEFGKFFCHKGI